MIPTGIPSPVGQNRLNFAANAAFFGKKGGSSKSEAKSASSKKTVQIAQDARRIAAIRRGSIYRVRDFEGCMRFCRHFCKDQGIPYEEIVQVTDSSNG